MKVPEDIRKVKRPVNTVVEYTGKDGIYKYPVRERSCVKYVKGGNPQPRNGKAIGHIIDYKYVPLKEKAKPVGECQSYGAAALIHSVSEDILNDLMDIYPAKLAHEIMAIASLKVEKPGIKISRLASRYSSSYISRFYYGAALSQSTVGKLYDSLGKDFSKRADFFAKRIERISENTILLIDGTLKENNSIVNDLAHYTRKSNVKGIQDISLIYAYDGNAKEPVCCEVFPGNHVDSSAYANFISHNSIKRGLIIDDKGFPVKKIEKALDEYPELHFLTPLKRNDSRIESNNMLAFDEVLDGIQENILAKKKQIKGGHYLYAFRDTYKAVKEMATAIQRAKIKKTFDGENYAKKEDSFGTIVFESDLDMSCKDAYLYYSCRWELELLFKTYKSNLQLTTTNVQNDYSVFGSEFINFISTLITQRIINKFIELELLEDDTYGDIMDDLCMAWRKYKEKDDPKANDRNWIHVNVGTMDKMKLLGLCK